MASPISCLLQFIFPIKTGTATVKILSSLTVFQLFENNYRLKIAAQSFGYLDKRGKIERLLTVTKQEKEKLLSDHVSFSNR